MLDIRVHINDEPPKRVSVAMYINMYIDEYLKWIHIDNTILKIGVNIGVLQSLRTIIPTYKLKVV